MAHVVLNHLVIGQGEVGRALASVLGTGYAGCVYVRDVEATEFVPARVDVLHICYPWHDDFVATTHAYQHTYKPFMTVIHSTVKPGTSDQCGAVYSPVIGQHPYLADAMCRVRKVVGTSIDDEYELVAAFFAKCGVGTVRFSSALAAELAKVLCTTQYGLDILVCKHIAALCETHGVPFREVYESWTAIYNNGYADMNLRKFMRPVLSPMPGPIGGHCVVPNCDLFDDKLTRLVKSWNAEFST